jgi:hypothetical protein
MFELNRASCLKRRTAVTKSPAFSASNASRNIRFAAEGLKYALDITRDVFVCFFIWASFYLWE